LHLVTFEQPSQDEEAGGELHGRLADAALGFETLEFSRPGVRRFGALIPPGPHAGDVIDLNRALAVKLAYDDVGAPEAEADSLLPSSLHAYLRRPGAHSRAETVLAWTLDALGRYDAPDLVRAGVVLPRRNLRLCAPLTRPGKIVAVARNYRAHADERGSDTADEPTLFLKASSAVVGPNDDIVIPNASREVDYEGELAAVIGRVAHEVTEAEALDYVAGYSAANDVTARDYQNVRGQHWIGKSCDTFAPLGPALVTSDEIEDPQDLGIRTIVSGETMQDARTKEMVFSVAQLVAFASRLMTLEPGDVLLTGTPAGVGAARSPARFLRDGDVVDVEIQHIGRLRNYVRGASA
jgi:2-keto-4-pentenoate hydratase/2-oxohepta-3-ene-1,7-dioic acid hydratase in catechol pathway